MNYRSPKILKAAKDAPLCFGCGKHNDGTVIAAHSNQLKDGKGIGIKAHDYRVAYICHDCHQLIDTDRISRQEKTDTWETAHRRTIGWLFDSGIVNA